MKDSALQQNLDFVETEVKMNILLNEKGLSGDMSGYIQTKQSGRINLSGQIKTLELSETSSATQQSYEFQYPDFKVVIQSMKNTLKNLAQKFVSSTDKKFPKKNVQKFC